MYEECLNGLFSIVVDGVPPDRHRTEVFSWVIIILCSQHSFSLVYSRYELLRFGFVLFCHFDVGCWYAQLLAAPAKSFHYCALEYELWRQRHPTLAPVAELRQSRDFCLQGFQTDELV